MKINYKVILPAIAFLLFGSNALAAGYSSNLYSTSGLGTSYAGSATGMHDASDMFFNAANLSDLENSEFIFSISHLDVDIDPDGVSGKTSAGASVSGTEVSDAGQDLQVPALYIAAPLSEDVTFGFAITVPFGLSTKYDADWIGKGSAIESSVAAYNFNPAISYKVNKKLAVAAGVQAQYYKAALTKYPSALGGGTAKSHGTDWGYGYNLGLTFKPIEKLKFGIGYRSKIEHKVEGRTNVQSSALDVYTGFNLNTTTPESIDAGLSYEITDKTKVAYDFIWNRWSRVQSLIVRNHQTLGDDALTLNWHDSFMHSLGVQHEANDKLTLRAGLAFEKEGIPAATREPRVPAGDRIWTSFGFNYKLPQGFSIDAAYVHQFFETVRVNNSATSTNNSVSAKYKTKVNIYSLALKKEF